MDDDMVDIEVEDTLVQPAPQAGMDDVEISVIDPADEAVDAQAVLQARIAELEASNAQAQQTVAQQMPMSQLAQELAKLTKANTPAPVVAEAPKTDFKALTDKVNKNFYSNPSEGIVTLLTPLLEQMNAKVSSDQAGVAKQLSYLSVNNDASLKAVYDSYKDEVDSLVTSATPSASVYQDAIAKVRTNHYSDILNKDVETRVAEEVAKALAAQGIGNTRVLPPTFTNASAPRTVPTGAPQAKKMQVSTQDYKAAKQWADTKGYDWEDKKEQLWVLNYLKEEGAIK